jgi:hypothetical protein
VRQTRSAEVAWVVATLCLAWSGTRAQEGQADQGGSRAARVVYVVKPSQTDPSIQHFDEDHYVVFDPAENAHGELVVFLPGTDGKPAGAARLMHVVASQGYRVIGLEYDDEPAVVKTCPRDPSPECSGEFRRERIFGNATSHFVRNPPAETIVNRLVKLLEYLDREHPQEQWGSYLRDGAPDWGRIVVSGLSQGAGMAAYIAKRESVARVVLFSSPWDYYGSGETLAPWLKGASATPPERWFAEYHKREHTARLIVRAYKALGIPPDNILVFDLDIPRDMHPRSDNPFHTTTIKLPGYEAQWRVLFGHSP